MDCCVECFSAVPGWDAVTGLGSSSPNFEVIANLVINQDSEFPNRSGVEQTVTPNDDSTTSSKGNVSFILSIVGIIVAGLSIMMLGTYLLIAGSFFKLSLQRQQVAY